MLELIAQGTTIDQRWRKRIPPDTEIEIGRASKTYRVPWDSQVSRRHVVVNVKDHHISVTRLPTAANPVFFSGDEVDQFVVQPGQHFVIGSTTFLLAADQAFGSMSVPSPFSQRTFSADFLNQVKYRDADRRIDVLNRIPEVISNANDTEELLTGMVNTLMAGISTATTIGIVAVGGHSEDEESSDASLRVIHWDRRGFDRGDFQPSAKLAGQAIELGQSVLNVWHPDLVDAQDEYTFDYENDWAFVCPIESQATHQWAIYVAGRNRSQWKQGSTQAPVTGESGIDELDLDGDIKFCELVGSTLKNLLQVQRLERQQASLRTFFSPVVVEAIRGRDADEVLLPRKCNVTVLFCDLRGFAKTSEAMADDLLGLLERVSEALGITTGAVLDRGGVVGDFHGDAVMGFWGWPLAEAALNENALAAVRTALDIQSVFTNDRAHHPRLLDFQMGLGLASGPAVAGKIGTRDQVKVTAFGPVVNLASRLEGMTRRLRSSILCDAMTAQRIAEAKGRSPLLRRLGEFQPFGLENSIDVFQVLPEASVSNEDLTLYEDALRAFTQGNWSQAIAVLNKMTPTDSARLFLEDWIKGRDGPPDEFVGVIQMTNK